MEKSKKDSQLNRTGEEREEAIMMKMIMMVKMKNMEIVTIRELKEVEEGEEVIKIATLMTIAKKNQTAISTTVPRKEKSLIGLWEENHNLA